MHPFPVQAAAHTSKVESRDGTIYTIYSKVIFQHVNPLKKIQHRNLYFSDVDAFWMLKQSEKYLKIWLSQIPAFFSAGSLGVTRHQNQSLPNQPGSFPRTEDQGLALHLRHPNESNQCNAALQCLL